MKSIISMKNRGKPDRAFNACLYIWQQKNQVNHFEDGKWDSHTRGLDSDTDTSSIALTHTVIYQNLHCKLV